MTAVPETYTWQDRLVDLTGRPYRFALWIIAFGLVFVAGRFWFMLAVGILAIAYGLRRKKFGGGWLAGGMAVLMASFLIAHLYSMAEAKRVGKFVSANTPIELSAVPDGIYYGKGAGTNGDIELVVTVKDGVFENIRLINFREAVYAFDDVIKGMIGKSSTDFSGTGDFVFRNLESLAGFTAAVNDALLTARPDYPKEGKLAGLTFFLTTNSTGRIMLNTLAILFIAIVSFDFFLQPTLAKGTGQALNCYNCQGCVGVCPVKMVAGDPFPMIMVIEARAGNYEKVAQYAKYCVGCGKCASKCPVGNSGPSISSSSYLLWKQELARDKRKQQARLRGWPTLDQLSREEADE